MAMAFGQPSAGQNACCRNSAKVNGKFVADCVEKLRTRNLLETAEWRSVRPLFGNLCLRNGTCAGVHSGNPAALGRVPT